MNGGCFMEHYGLLSILPPLVAIGLCIVSRQLIISLFVGVFSGALVLSNFNPIMGFVKTIKLSISTLASEWNAGIVIFTLLLGGLIGILSKSGGAQGLVNLVIKKVNNGKRGQLTTALLSILLFFDDYTSIVLSGSVMRPLTDKLRISREKLSYIVDSAGAGVSATAPISNWTAFEVGVIGEVIATIGITSSAYMVFLQSIPFRFYCIFSVAFVFMIALQRRDFGPMYHAEKRALTTGKVIRDGATPMAGISEAEFSPPPGIPLRASNFFVPIICFFITAVIGFYVSGGGAEAGGIAEIMGAADVLAALVVACVVATGISAIMLLVQKILTIDQITDAWTNGLKAIVFTIAFIVLAWAVAAVCKELGTAKYLVQALVAMNFPPGFLPFATFILACLIAFATGTSWGTMALVLPLALPAAQAIDASMIATLGAVLTGATFGDHCSPISESVVLSSMAAAADHLDHVATQIPYALTAAAISGVVGFIPAGYGVSPWLTIPAGLVVSWVVIRLVGKKTDEKSLGVSDIIEINESPINPGQSI
jgi:Na+/H+ antiporter NhaC